MKTIATLLLFVSVMAPLTVGCLRVKHEVEPITLNVNLKIDRELDDFFAYEKQLGPAPATMPAAPTTTTSNREQP